MPLARLRGFAAALRPFDELRAGKLRTGPVVAVIFDSGRKAQQLEREALTHEETPSVEQLVAAALTSRILEEFSVSNSFRTFFDDNSKYG